MKKVLFFVMVVFCLFFNTNDFYIMDRDSFSFRYKEYEVYTNYQIKSYHYRKDKDYCYLDMKTKDDSELVLKWLIDFQGMIELSEKCEQKTYKYDYYIKKNMNKIEKQMILSENIDVHYQTYVNSSSCYFDGEIIKKEYSDYNSQERFYFCEDGTQRKLLHKEIVLKIEKI